MISTSNFESLPFNPNEGGVVPLAVEYAPAPSKNDPGILVCGIVCQANVPLSASTHEPHNCP